MATNPYFAGAAEMAVRLLAFNKNLPTLSDDELFEEFRSINERAKGAVSGRGEGESEDLLNKGLSAEAEISRRNGGNGLLAYNSWLKGSKSPGGGG